MKSMLREILIELLSHNSKLLVELLRPHGEHGWLEGLASEVLTIEVVSAPRHRPEHVRVFRDEHGAAVYAIVVDVQEHIDASKPWIWPLYATATFAALRCPTALVVIAPDPHVARWVRAPGSTDEDRLNQLVRPIVLSYRDVPRVVEAVEARRHPELALLSALAHPCREVVAAAAVGLASLEDRARARRYRAAVRLALPEALREGLASPEDDAAERAQRREMQAVLHQLSRLRLGGLTRDDELAVGLAASDDEPALQLVTGLAYACDAAQAREVIYEVALDYLRGHLPSKAECLARGAAWAEARHRAADRGSERGPAEVPC
jgi:hypothetical protein